jgi:hypothetical protein
MTESGNSTRPIKKQERSVAITPAAPERPPQTIRGNYLIVSRKAGGRLKRIALSPYEHGSLKEAEAQAAVLAARHGGEFSVFHQVATVLPPVVQEAPELIPEPTLAPEFAVPPQRRPLVVERRTSRAVKQGGRA